MPERWNIHLASWVIQDGSYPDFVKGQTAEFAVEFWIPPGSGIVECDGEPGVTQSSSDYDATAKCVVQNTAITLLDIGILVYRHEGNWNPDFPFKAGRTFRTVLRMGVDPFSCFGVFDAAAAEIPLVYTWRIDSIFMLDPDLGYAEMPQTNAWDDDAGHAQYLFNCELLPLEPKNTSATTMP